MPPVDSPRQLRHQLEPRYIPCGSCVHVLGAVDRSYIIEMRHLHGYFDTRHLYPLAQAPAAGGHSYQFKSPHRVHLAFRAILFFILASHRALPAKPRSWEILHASRRTRNYRGSANCDVWPSSLHRPYSCGEGARKEDGVGFHYPDVGP